MTTINAKMNIDEKYKLFKANDPFPKIQPSLLNSADIKSYVETVGLIDPFNENDLKSASYAAKIAGECKYWDEDSKTFSQVTLEKTGDKLKLKPNAIAFVGIEPTFRLPDYIALRFNLKITHVYRGLLLGTGPLIDPGFVGKISIPLHNLTRNEYVFSFGEHLIWIEFTKTSELPIPSVLSENDLISYESSRCRSYAKFDENKTNKDLDFYIRQALKGTPHESIASSVPSAVNKALESAENAEKSASTIKNWGIASALGVIIGVAALVINTWNLQKSYFTEAINQVSSLRSEISSFVQKSNQTNDEISNEVRIIDQNLINLAKDQSETIKQLTSRIENLEKNNKAKNETAP